MIKVKNIAFYLPQYHPIPENDLWWGKGFTEWTNVVKSKPLFKGHDQPFLPSDLGYYDLRIPEIYDQQVNLASNSGIYGFCFWHYWFGNGKQLLEKPIRDIVLKSENDFPFSLAWANQTWSGTWHGLRKGETLIKQLYPGPKDYIDHFYTILPILLDKRYIRTEKNNLVFTIFRPWQIPNLEGFTELWNSLLLKEANTTFHFIGVSDGGLKNDYLGLDALTESLVDLKYLQYNRLNKFFRGIPKTLKVCDYEKYIEYYAKTLLLDKHYPTVFPMWDNTPRSNNNGWLFDNSTPQLFGNLLDHAIQKSLKSSMNDKFIFIKSWNEWAEGNVLEPSRLFQNQYLEVISRTLKKLN